MAMSERDLEAAVQKANEILAEQGESLKAQVEKLGKAQDTLQKQVKNLKEQMEALTASQTTQ